MNRASTALSSDVASQKYAEFEQQVKQEVEKVKNLDSLKNGRTGSNHK